MRPKVYLAGPITGLTYDESTDWRGSVTTHFRALRIEALSPLRGKEYLQHVGKLKDQYLEMHPLSAAPGIVARDRFDCQRSDAVLMNLLGAERVSIGSMMEAAWADAARVPLILVDEPGSVHDHAMLKQIAGFITDDILVAQDIVVAILKGDFDQ